MTVSKSPHSSKARIYADDDANDHADAHADADADDDQPRPAAAQFVLVDSMGICHACHNLWPPAATT